MAIAARLSRHLRDAHANHAQCRYLPDERCWSVRDHQTGEFAAVYGDDAKGNTVAFGFRLPSALEQPPLRFRRELDARQTVFVSHRRDVRARKSGGSSSRDIRPTVNGPPMNPPVRGNRRLMGEIRQRVAKVAMLSKNPSPKRMRGLLGVHTRSSASKYGTCIGDETPNA